MTTPPPHQPDEHEFMEEATRKARAIITTKLMPHRPELGKPCLEHLPDEVHPDGTCVWERFHGDHDPTMVVITPGGASVLCGGFVNGGKAKCEYY